MCQVGMVINILSFAVINADDYYGKDGFRKAAHFLLTGRYALVMC